MFVVGGVNWLVVVVVVEQFAVLLFFSFFVFCFFFTFGNFSGTIGLGGDNGCC